MIRIPLVEEMVDITYVLNVAHQDVELSTHIKCKVYGKLNTLKSIRYLNIAIKLKPKFEDMDITLRSLSVLSNLELKNHINELSQSFRFVSGYKILAASPKLIKEYIPGGRYIEKPYHRQIFIETDIKTAARIKLLT